MRFSRHSAVIVCVSVMAACGSGSPTETGSAAREPRGTPREYEGRVQELRARLDLALGHPPSQLAPGETEVLRDLEAEDAPAQTDTAAPQPASEPDCDVAADLRNRVCELAARICRAAHDAPNDGERQAMCERATTTCEDARRDVAVNCE